ncbi:MAG: hypothetical protein R8G66_15895 [Cytophagales bacterium]|nr:hypothetical protein [Cytophagales bacterium]
MKKHLLMLSILLNLLFLFSGFSIFISSDENYLLQDTQESCETSSSRAVSYDQLEFDTRFLDQYWKYALPDALVLSETDSGSYIRYQPKLIESNSRDSMTVLVYNFLRMYTVDGMKPTLNRVSTEDNPQQYITSYVIESRDLSAALSCNPEVSGIKVIEALKMDTNTRAILDSALNGNTSKLDQLNVNSILSHVYVVPVRHEEDADSVRYFDIEVFRDEERVAFDLTLPCPICAREVNPDE